MNVAEKAYTLDLIGLTKDAKTAGPGRRLEVFTKGCIRGMVNPCKGCFNEETWTFEGPKRSFDKNELASMIERDAWNRLVTFCGGEPMIQAISLTALAKELKKRDTEFHIIMYTAYKLDTLIKHGLKFTWVKEKHGKGMLDMLLEHASSYVVRDSEGLLGTQPIYKIVEFTILEPNDVLELMRYVDLIVDGDYQQDYRLTTDPLMHDGGFIGSSNQRVFHCKLTLSDFLQGKELSFLYADQYNEALQDTPRCKTCARTPKLIETPHGHFCGSICEDRYVKRVAFLESQGLKVKGRYS